jgi:FMN phosphatase YigB (HAD superfamily)
LPGRVQEAPRHFDETLERSSRTGRHVAGLGISTFFSDVITSGLVGYEKPHARMFEAAVRSSIPGCPIWTIGDNVECDCHPVRAFGAEAILVRATARSFERHAADLWHAPRLIAGA